MKNIPGFAAEAALYKTSKHYSMVAASHHALAQVVPQFKCGPCTCDRGDCCMMHIEGGKVTSCSCSPGPCPVLT